MRATLFGDERRAIRQQEVSLGEFKFTTVSTFMRAGDQVQQRMRDKAAGVGSVPQRGLRLAPKRQVLASVA